MVLADANNLCASDQCPVLDRDVTCSTAIDLFPWTLLARIYLRPRHENG